MNYIDYIILAFLSIGFILGFKDGLVRKIIGMVGFVASLFIAFQFSAQAGEILLPVFNQDADLAQIVGGIIIFFLSLFVVAILKRVFHPVDKVSKFVNQLLGGISGTIQMIYFISGFLILIGIFNMPSEKDRNNSALYQPMYSVVPVTVNFVLGENSQAKKFLNNYIDTK